MCLTSWNNGTWNSTNTCSLEGTSTNCEKSMEPEQHYRLCYPIWFIKFVTSRSWARSTRSIPAQLQWDQTFRSAITDGSKLTTGETVSSGAGTAQLCLQMMSRTPGGGGHYSNFKKTDTGGGNIPKIKILYTFDYSRYMENCCPSDNQNTWIIIYKYI
jgi:hypothetical protein